MVAGGSPYHDHDHDVWKVYLAQDVKHGFVALKTVDSQRMGVVSLYLK